MYDRIVLPVGSGGACGTVDFAGLSYGVILWFDTSLKERMQDFLPTANLSILQLDYSAVGRGFAKLRPEDLEFQDYFLGETGVFSIKPTI